MKSEHFAVMVWRNGEQLLTIESNHLSGKPDLSPDDEAAIETAGRHLLAFIGARDPEVGALPLPQEASHIDNGNIYVFCDYVDTSGAKPQGCIRGAGHSGDHVITDGPYPMYPVLARASVSQGPQASQFRDALQHIMQVLGPSPCSVNSCDGCASEVYETLRTLRGVGIEYTYRDITHEHRSPDGDGPAVLDSAPETDGPIGPAPLERRRTDARSATGARLVAGSEPADAHPTPEGPQE